MDLGFRLNLKLVVLGILVIIRKKNLNLVPKPEQSRGDVKLSNNLFFLLIFCIKNPSNNLHKSLIFITFKHEIHQRNQQKPTPAFCLID